MVLDKWKIELRVKKSRVDISTTPRQNTLHGPYHRLQGTDRLLTPPPVKAEDYENLVNSFKTCTLRSLINWARGLLIFLFFSIPIPPPYSGVY